MQYTEFGVICRNMNDSLISSLDEKIRKEILQVFSKRIGKKIHLRVGVLNGIVHLAGAVETNDTRTLTEELISEINGVRGVVNRIEAPGSPHPARIIHLDLNKK